MPQENEELFNFYEWISAEDILLQEIIRGEHGGEQQLGPQGLLTNHQVLPQQPNYVNTVNPPPQPITHPIVQPNFHVPAPLHYIENPAEIKEEDGSQTPSPPINNEESVNLNSFNDIGDESQVVNNNQWLGGTPYIVPNLNSWTGSLNFRISIPPPKLEGIKPKWCYSYLLDKVFVAKQIAFPVSLTLDAYPDGAAVVICPVFIKSEHRMTPVLRCPNCQTTDSNPVTSEHVVQVEGSYSTYLLKDARHMVAVPLGSPAPGDVCVNLFLKVTCNTSCTGGPNRRPFSLLLSLKLKDREIGRQIINIRCCEGPDRDRSKEEAAYLKSHPEIQDNYIAEVRRVADEIAVSNRRTSAKRKKSKVPMSSEMVTLSVPKHHLKKIRKYVNFLHMKEQLNGNKKLKKYYQSESDSD